MKRILTIALAIMLLTPSCLWAQEKEDSLKSVIDDMETLSLSQMEDGDYQKALDTRDRQLKLIEENFGKTDSAYCHGLIFRGKCQARLKRCDEAAKTLEEAACIYGDNFSRADYNYAVMLDNWSIYLALNEEYEKSKEKVDSSLTIFCSLPEL